MPAHESEARERQNEDPFHGNRANSNANRWRNGLIGALVVGAAMVVAVVATRSKNNTATAKTQQSAAPAPGTAQPVMLSAEQARRIGVTFAAVELGTLQPEVRTVAVVTVDETRVRTVTLKFDGWIDRLFVNTTGSDVRAGEPLLATYAPMLVSGEQELILAARLVRDVAGADSVTRANAVEMRAAARQRLLNWDVPAAEVERVERTGDVPKTLVIRAPYSGVIVDKPVVAGQRVMAGEPLYRVVDLSVVWVEGEVFERDLPIVRLGENVEVELQAFPGVLKAGRIIFMQPTVNIDTRTVRVRVVLDNANGLLKPGMYATLHIRGAAGVAVLQVPRSAVLSTGTRDLVFVKRADGQLEPRDVVLGLATDNRVEIKRGVRAGETVVASATFLVDAESNLGSALGGMGGMPGMDVSPPVRPSSQVPAVTAPPKAAPPMPDMPGNKKPGPLEN